MIIGKRFPSSRKGVTLPEVLIVFGIVAVLLMVVVMSLLPSRESARLAACSNHLAQIGRALAQYDGAVGHLPRVDDGGPGPLAVLTEQFGFEYFGGNPKAKPSPLGAPATPRRVGGFICVADPNLSGPSSFTAPSSYRGNAGPGTNGQGGAFAFGKNVAISDAESAAGTDFVAAMSERLIGSGKGGKSPTNDYQIVVGPIGDEACPAGPDEAWKGDAGSSWMSANWTSTLYNHAMLPDGSPSCVSEDGKSARMGASSGHVNRVNVLTLGGGVRGFTTTVDPVIWKKFGAVPAKSPVADPQSQSKEDASR